MRDFHAMFTCINNLHNFAARIIILNSIFASHVEHMRSKEADKEKKQRNVLGSSACLFYLAGQELSLTQLRAYLSRVSDSLDQFSWSISEPRI